MDVRCERCNAQYAVDDGLVHEGGLAVRCAMCGHSFKVMRSEAWSLRKSSGDVYPLPDAATLQRWVVEGRVTRQDEVAQPGRAWVKAGDLKELAPFFAVVDQARRARTGPARAAEPSGTPAPVRDRASETGEMSLGSPAAVPAETWQAPTTTAADAHEPAWASGPSAASAQSATARPRTATPRKQETRTLRRWPLLALGFVVLVVLGVAAGAAGFYVLKPDAVPPAVGKLLHDLNPWASDSGALTRDASPPSAPATPGVRPPSQPPVPDVPAPTPAPAPTTPPVTPAPGGAGPDRAQDSAPPAATAATEPTPPAGRSENGPETPAAPPSPTPAPSAGPEASAGPAPDAAPPTAAPETRPAPAAPVPGPDRPRAAAPAAPPEKRAEAPKKSVSLLAQARQLRDSGRATAALDVYARALQANPSNADALAGRGLAYLDLSSYRQAEESFRAALETNGSHPSALMGLAETYRYQGKRAEALTLYRKYLADHPRGEDATAARKAVQALEGSP